MHSRETGRSLPLTIRPLRLAAVCTAYAALASAASGQAPTRGAVLGPAARPEHAAGRLYFDRAHGGYTPPFLEPALDTVLARVGLRRVNGTQPLTATALRGSRVLYLRAPTAAFTAPEKAAVVAFVRGGGSLLLVVDEERRQPLAVTGVNDLIAPFGLRLTPDTKYVPNPGALAPAGEITHAARELPYDGGRAVEGGMAFAFQLDSAGRPAQPYAASTRVPGGGRVIVLAEGMASLFLGQPGARRLDPAVADGAPTTGWWGQDSRKFMEDVLAWLAHR